jgi:hypothetical protein
MVVMEPTASGGCGHDKQVIRRVIAARAWPQVKHCYEVRLAQKPTLAGRLVVAFRIDDRGEVSGARAEGFDPQVDACVVKVIESLRFPGPGGGCTAQVSYPFVFAPAE